MYVVIMQSIPRSSLPPIEQCGEFGIRSVGRAGVVGKVEHETLLRVVRVARTSIYDGNLLSCPAFGGALVKMHQSRARFRNDDQEESGFGRVC